MSGKPEASSSFSAGYQSSETAELYIVSSLESSSGELHDASTTCMPALRTREPTLNSKTAQPALRGPLEETEASPGWKSCSLLGPMLRATTKRRDSLRSWTGWTFYSDSVKRNVIKNRLGVRMRQPSNCYCLWDQNLMPEAL